MASFPLPPLDDGPSGMTRRNYLVERYRMRVKAYEPTRKVIEEEELAKATARRNERMELLNSWKGQSGGAVDVRDDPRPLPGGAPNKKRSQEALREMRTMRQHEAERKAAQQEAYRADMLHQLEERHLTLRLASEREERLDKEEQQYNEIKNRAAEEEERLRKEELKAFHRKIKEVNRSEQKKKRREQQIHEAQDRELFAFVQEQERHRIAEDERRAKDSKRLMHLRNQEYHAQTKKREAEIRAKEEAEMKAHIAADKAAAERERQEQLQKKQRFLKEMEECMDSQKEFRRLHNYDEPEDQIRLRNMRAARDLHLIKQEERRRALERQQQYRSQLVDQMRWKYNYELEHPDDVL